MRQAKQQAQKASRFHLVEMLRLYRSFSKSSNPKGSDQ